MAKVLAPLLSFSASGKLANSIVAYTWHGINCIRQYVIGRDPKTPAQLACRNDIRVATFGWKHYITDSLTRQGWTNFATIDERPMTGYNGAVSNMTLAHKRIGNSNFVNSSTWIDNRKLRINLIDYTTGLPLNEAVTFSIFYGDVPETLDKVEFVPQTVAGSIDLDFTPPQKNVLYFHVQQTVSRNGREPTEQPPP